ncbi:hypothetical protein L7F22_039000 [Adiantum nelumboides]|nr:hypothetical protein [Adiantum nelumboides]
MGGPPEKIPEVYKSRSPIYMADRIRSPLLILQGEIDKVVPPAQNKTIYEAVKKQGVKTKYIEFEGEGHGFRKSENIKRSLEEEEACCSIPGAVPIGLFVESAAPVASVSISMAFCVAFDEAASAAASEVEPDRSRGRYEILESQKDTLLTALRSVAPELASQFERGDLHITSPMGSKAENNGDTARKRAKRPFHRESKAHDDQFQHSVSDTSGTEHNPMVPDLEDGRPRYFGGSSTFGNISGLESRPTSPPSQNKKSLQEAGSSIQATQYTHPQEGKRPRSSSVTAKNNFSVLPSPMPQFPRNSMMWVRELRRKTLVAVGRDDIYASEGLPSNDDSILRKMLLPQCANHARSTLRALRELQQIRGISISYFFLHQSFLSASTFILTIWHGTNDKDMLLEDSDIIEFSLEVYNQQSRFASVLVQRAHRILRNIALRCLPLLTDDERRRRMQELLRQSGVLGGGIAPATLNAIGQSGVDIGSRSANRYHSESIATEGGYQGRSAHSPLSNSTQTASMQSYNGQNATYPSNFAVPISQHSPFKRPPSRSDSDRGRTSVPSVINGDYMSHSSMSGQYVPVWNRMSGGERSGGIQNTHEINQSSLHSSSPLRPQHTSSLDVIGNTPFNIEDFQSQIGDDLGTGMQSFQFNGDLSWTDYFDRFLGRSA